MNKQQNIYETDKLVSMYCDFQYGEDHLGVENFAVACAKKAIAYSQNIEQGKALDLGCATGRATFELARVFKQVCGVDYSQNFVQVAAALQRNDSISYQQQGEGALSKHLKVHLDDFDLGATRNKVNFLQRDACALDQQLHGYNLIMATNLIDRLYQPALFLSSIDERINQHGYLVLTSPYTWLEEYTKKEFWLGGYDDANGNEVSSFDGLKQRLATNFDLVACEDVPFVIRETARKFQYTIAQMTVWQKK
ncbi:MAG: putative 4-mercaptohistidine N1-methyltransferase [Alteromonadaceae bacterium]|jgi:putative 4-mercaptohistidine N1-methyltranferase